MKTSKQEGCSQTCYMCRNCIPEWMPAIRANRKHFEYRKGELIFKEGDMVNGMFFVESGAVKVHKQWGADKELIVRIAKKGDILGHRGLGADTIYPVSATALERVVICFIDLAFFTATLRVNPGFLYELMMFFASELKVSERKMRNLAHMHAKGRLAQAILNLVDKFGENERGFVALPISKQDLAAYSGATYETVFRMLQEMIEQGIVKTEGKEIMILNRGALAELTVKE
jgi:CRP/FNR family transcriptional regulator